MKAQSFGITILASMLLSLMATAQSSGQSSPSTSSAAAPEEKNVGGYVVQESFEFGYRVTDLSNQKLSPTDPTNPAMYNTLVNLHDGPRLLDQTLSLRSPEHNGVLFDELLVSGFGFGGDPDNVARLQVSKYRWYDF